VALRNVLTFVVPQNLGIKPIWGAIYTIAEASGVSDIAPPAFGVNKTYKPSRPDTV
jgi:hypothetical protein